MVRVLIVFAAIFGLMLFWTEKALPENPYVPKKLNIWLDDRFFELYQNKFDSESCEVYSTKSLSNRELLKSILELERLILESNMIMIKQNERIINLLEKSVGKRGSKE